MIFVLVVSVLAVVDVITDEQVTDALARSLAAAELCVSAVVT